MIKFGHVDINQYRQDFSHQKKKDDKVITHSRIQKNSIKKSLEDNVSFKGFQITKELKNIKGYFVPLIIKPPEELVKKVFNTLNGVSSEQHKYYTEIRKNFVNLVKSDENFRKKYSIPERVAENISETNLYFIPKDQVAVKFIKNLISPLTYIGKKTQKFFAGSKSDIAKNNAYYEKTAKEYKCLEGLIRSVEIWENGYRRLGGMKEWSRTEDFIIPDEILYTNLNRRRIKIVDPTKGKYSSTSLMIGNRFISGMVYAYFLGNDAYNTTMRYSGNKSEANVQRKSRIAQEFSRIGLNMYIQNLLFGTLESSVNKSLPFALIVSGSTTAFSEILGRKLVGKPIVPSNKETLDRMEAEMQAKTGILPAIGKMLTGVKKKEQTPQAVQLECKNPPNSTLFASFSTVPGGQSGISDTQKNNPSFKGFFANDRLLSKTRVTTLLKILENADYKQAQFLKKTLLNSIKYSDSGEKNGKVQKFFQELDKVYDIRCISDADCNSAYERILSMTSENIPVGKAKTLHGQITKSFLVPLNFIRNIIITVKNWSFGYSNLMSGKDASKLTHGFYSKKIKLNAYDMQDMQKYYEHYKKEFPWNNENMPEKIKKTRLFKEYIKLREQIADDIEGAKNLLLLIEKEASARNIKLAKDGTLSDKDVEKVRKILKDLVLKADGARHVEYDGNTLSQMNVNLGRAITTIFLVTDASNLTMQYSNDNKKAAKKSATNRTAQEISRIGLSAYMLAFVHNLLSKLCNSSLAGAFGITALTSVINDSLSRKVVGVPITPKTKDQLLEIDRQNNKSKSPIKKALAYSLGKKNSIPASIKPVSMHPFFITPAIEKKKKSSANSQ